MHEIFKYIIMNYLPHLLFFSLYIYAHTLHIRYWWKKFGFNLNNVENDREKEHLKKIKGYERRDDVII